MERYKECLIKDVYKEWGELFESYGTYVEGFEIKEELLHIPSFKNRFNPI